MHRLPFDCRRCHSHNMLTRARASPHTDLVEENKETNTVQIWQIHKLTKVKPGVFSLSLSLPPLFGSEVILRIPSQCRSIRSSSECRSTGICSISQQQLCWNATTTTTRRIHCKRISIWDKKLKRSGMNKNTKKKNKAKQTQRIQRIQWNEQHKNGKSMWSVE